jgi:hypothetical protein
MNKEFWSAIDRLVRESEIVIDRPKGSAHPRYSNFLYKVDYGYLKIHHLWMEVVLISGKVQRRNRRSMPSYVLLTC